MELNLFEGKVPLCETQRLFYKYQNPILKLANNHFGRLFLGIANDKINNFKRIVGMSPNAVHYDNGDDTITSVFRTYPLFAKKLFHALNTIEILNDVKEYSRLNKYQGLLNYCGFFKDNAFPLVLFDVTADPFYSDSGGDGTIQRFAAGTWDSIRNGTVGTSNGDGGIQTRDGYDSQYFVCRGYTPFDTSSLPNAIKMISGTWKIYGTYRRNTSGQADSTVKFNIYASTQASNTALGMDDFPAKGDTQLAADVLYTNTATGTYNTWTLNAAGLLNINPAGWSKFCSRENYDYTGDVPGTGYREFSAYDSDRAGTTEDPRLDLVYKLKKGGGMLMGIG